MTMTTTTTTTTRSKRKMDTFSCIIYAAAATAFSMDGQHHGVSAAAAAAAPVVPERSVTHNDASSSSSLLLLRRPEQEQQRQSQDQQQRQLQEQQQQQRDDPVGRMLECIPSGITDFDSCSSFCNATTSSSFNTFIVLDGPVGLDGTVGEQSYCCACFSGPNYCADGIPQCASFANLDPEGTFHSVTRIAEPMEMLIDPIMSTNETVSCVDDVGVSDEVSCGDFCTLHTGLSGNVFDAQLELDEYYCLCTTMVDGESVFCNDNIDEDWDAKLDEPKKKGIKKEDDESASSPLHVRDRIDNGDRLLEVETVEGPTCRNEGVRDYVSCEQFCMATTGHALTTFSTMTTSADEEEQNHCCACYHGDSYCSDNVPLCQSYTNLVAREAEASDEGMPEDSQVANDDDDPSCLALDIKSSPACGDFCIMSTGNSEHSFGSIEQNEQYYCICHQTVLSSRRSGPNSSGSFEPRPRSTVSTDTSRATSATQNIFCSDNMEEGWQVFFLNQDSTDSVPNGDEKTSSASSQLPRYFPIYGLTTLCVSFFFTLVV
mmetsp:Transcript_5609/g.13559  ORF Transcript_5609/g.13559 Transcript_5609/m.13559 type:complete len:544 (+) Transcript_5609:393-2024(+)